MERALYDVDSGFYETGGRAGRSRGDFVTSPEVGPLFGAVLARALDAWWAEQGWPDPFIVHEHGAGPGTLVRTVLVDPPACASALRWTLVERSAHQRSAHPAHLPHVGSPGGEDWDTAGGGPLVASSADRPSGPVHVVLANELLDNLPFDLAEWTSAGWCEVRLRAPVPPSPVPGGASGPAAEDPWSDELVALDSDRSALLDRLVPAPAVGARVPLEDRAISWVEESLAGLASGGRLVLFDYGAATADLAHRPWTEWVRTYRRHGPGGSPWADPGSRDITVEVAVDQLPPPDRIRPQADALRDWGIEGLVDEARAMWRDRTAALDLASLRVRSRVGEAEALLDPAGLGGFHVLEWSQRRASPGGPAGGTGDAVRATRGSDASSA